MRISEQVPETTSEYLKAEYWNERFKTEEAYEWLGEYRSFAPHLRRYLVQSPQPSPPGTVLVVGNGNSSMGQSIALDDKICECPETCCITDIAPVAVAKSRERDLSEGTGRLSWAVCDMLSLPFRAESVDLIVEKGAMDVFETDRGEDPWHPNPLCTKRMHAWLSEAHRVLSPSGLLVSVSFAQPHFRCRLYDAEGYTWLVETQAYSAGDAVGEGGWEYFIYFARKGGRTGGAGLDGETARGCKDEDYQHEYMDEEDFLLRIQGDQGED